MTTPEKLARYLERIGLSAPPAVDPAGLEALQRAHRMGIGFENFDVLLGRGIRIDADSAFAKLVSGPAARGGFCFEHNRVFADMLSAAGFPNRPLLARVWLGLDDPLGAAPATVPPRTHTLLLVDLGGEPWIADAGFGGSYVPALPLRDGAEAETGDGARHRLLHVGAAGALSGEWLLERAGAASATDGRARDHGEFQPTYTFELAQVADADLAMGNLWASTAPQSRFTKVPVASVVVERGFVSLNGRRLTMHHDGRADVMEIGTAADYRSLLADLFRVELTEAEVMALALFPPDAA